MIGPAKRLITEEKVKNSSCSQCGEQNTLLAKVFSKMFILKILPFVYGKSTELSCSHCAKIYDKNDVVDPITQRRVDIIKDDAKHVWYLYLGYVFIAVAFIVTLFRDK
ncbi:MAG: hypothetical protein CMO82_01855 [Winogradskyella sp.]|nr:hypothetical protein [Winogradskyella sp.]|tara:strand:+ start:57 stop:380 length:324 start_codon:yes stop_codon:yes gene_type:complete